MCVAEQETLFELPIDCCRVGDGGRAGLFGKNRMNLQQNAILGSLPLRSGYNSDKLRFNAWFMSVVWDFLKDT